MFNKVACIHITTDYSLKIHIFHKLDVTEKWPFIVRCSKERMHSNTVSMLSSGVKAVNK